MMTNVGDAFRAKVQSSYTATRMATKILMSGCKSYIGHRLREALLLPDLLQPRRSTARSVMFLPSSAKSGSSLLRAENVALALRRQGWRTMTIPPQLALSQRRRMVRLFNPDILVFQQCRHPLNDVGHAFGRPFVLDIDDADFFDPKLQDRIVRMCLQACGVIAGSRFIADWCRQYNPNTTIIWTGTPITRGSRPSHRLRGPVIAWAQSDPLAYPEELAFVQDFCRRMAAGGVAFRLRLYGVDALEKRHHLGAMFGLGDRLETFPFLTYDRFITSLQEVAVGLSPVMVSSEFSRGKSFGKILAYLDAKVPVIASDEVDHALFFTPESGIISNSIEDWVHGAKRLLASPEARDQMAGAAFLRFQKELTTEAAAAKVARFLERLQISSGDHKIA